MAQIVRFINEDISPRLKERKRIKKWLGTITAGGGYEKYRLVYHFCSDEFLLTLNKEYLAHHTYTDIITFPYSNEHGLLEGEVFISLDRVNENAKKFRQDPATELKRVMVHGLLHLLGYKDKTPEEKEKMRAQEDLCLAAFSAY